MATISTDATGCSSKSVDTEFAGYREARELRKPRWRDLASAAMFESIGFRKVVTLGRPNVAHWVAGLQHNAQFHGIFHRSFVEKIFPSFAEVSASIQSVRHGLVGESTELGRRLSVRRLGRVGRAALKKKCHSCGATEGLTLHHMIRREMGGATEPGNLLCLCRTCHDAYDADPGRVRQQISDAIFGPDGRIGRLLNGPTTRSDTQADHTNLPGRSASSG